MSEAKSGDTVHVHYTGTLADGSEFDSSHAREPLQFQIGAGELIPGFEQAIIGMTPGDSRTVTIAAEDAYGPYRDEMVHTVQRTQIPDEIDLEVGRRLQATRQDGQPVVLTVVDLSESDVTLDANHPLAGKDLTFELTLVAIAA